MLTGEPLARFLDLIRGRLANHPRGEGAEYDVYPPGLTEPYRSRRFKCGEDMYATIGVPREDKPARLRQFARNYAFFGAPVGMFFCIDRQMGPPQWADLGMFMQNVMLLAREHGLHTCPQEAWAVWHEAVSEFLGVAADADALLRHGLGHQGRSGTDQLPAHRPGTARRVRDPARVLGVGKPDSVVCCAPRAASGL